MINAKTFYSLWLPILGAILTQFSFSITDSIMIAPFGEKYLGGIGIAGIYYTITLVFFNGFLDIFSNLLARNTSSSAQNTLPSLFFTLILIILTAAIGATFILLFSDSILSYFGLSQEVMQVVSNNLRILSYGAIFSIAYYACVIVIRVLGKASTTFWIVLLGSLFNLGGNWLFLYGPFSHWTEPENAVAYTTVISRFVMLIVMLFNVRHFVRFSATSHSLFLTFLKESISHYFFVLRKGTPSCARNLNDWLSSFILVLFLGSFGTSCSAANQTTDIISSAMYMFTQASCTTIGILFSKWIGENKRMLNSRVEIKKLSYVSSIPSLFVLLCVFIFRDSILDAFSLTRGSYTRQLAEIILFIHLITLPIYMVQHITNSFLDALFDTKIPSLFSLFISYIFVLPTVYICIRFYSFPPYAIWIIDAIGMAIISIFLVIRLLKKTENSHQNKNISSSILETI